MKAVFIIGTGRCGSTLIHEILAKHLDSSFLSTAEENHRRLTPLARWANTFYRAENAPLVSSFTKKFIPTEGYGLISRNVSPIYSRPYRNLTADDATPWLIKRFRAYFENRYQAYQRPVLVHKYTGWSRLGFFHKVFPEAKFVHIVRDGRAVANSWLQMRWWSGYQGPAKWLWGDLNPSQQALWDANQQSYVTLAGLCWNMLIDTYRDWQSLGLDKEQFIEVKYEDILAQPQGEIARLAEFCDLPWSKDFEQQLAGFDIRTSRKAAYQQDLGTDKLQELEAVVAESLQHYGYALTQASDS
ncbi:MAG: sulfotransferase [Pseudomonadota bacterium]